ncbi:MAG: hypothetical protein JWN72_1940 [Thermoleophilia bacterium]|nr:hypothetical protein [Thermoleophilia bacterium]
MELLTRASLPPQPTPASVPAGAPGYPGGAASAADHERMRAGAAAFTTAAALAAAQSAPLDGLSATFADGLEVIDALRANYPQPKTEWVAWEAQARSGGEVIRALADAPPATGAPHALLATVRSGALAGAQLLTAWDG